MKALVNELSPINRLPPEVLSIIPTFWPAHSQGDLIRATHVCRYWRTALIASPNLWNVVKSGHEARTRAFIHRSQSYPLSIEIKHPGQENVLSDVILFRLKSLTLNLPMKNLTKPLGKLVSPTPVLKELDITSSNSGGYFPTLKTGDFFMLSRLHLDGVATNFASLPIPNLTVLRLENSRNIPRLHDFLQFLERTPWLEELVLINTGPEGGRESSERVVKLRSLRGLTLHGTVAKAKLLQHLFIPASADINLMGRFNQRLDGFMEEFLPPSLENLPVTSNFTSVSITSTSGLSCDMEFSGNEGKLSVAVKNEIYRGIPGMPGRSPPAAVLCLRDLTPLVLDTVTHFAFRRDPGWGPQAFPEPSALREFLYQLPSLQSIDLVHCDFNLLTALNPVGVRLPFFHSLSIYVDPDAKIDFYPLSHLVKSKSSLNCPLDRLNLFVVGPTTRVVFKRSELDRLKQHIRVVEVEEVDVNYFTRT
jgi:hypothetical protein